MTSEKAAEGNRRRVRRWRVKNREQYNANTRRSRARKLVQRFTDERAKVVNVLADRAGQGVNVSPDHPGGGQFIGARAVSADPDTADELPGSV